jgi:hypothetical protein
VFNIKNKHNGIWEWHEAIADPQLIVSSIPDEQWQYYTNIGGGETIIGRSTFIWPTQDLHSKIMKSFLYCINEYCVENNLHLKDENVGQDWLMIREYKAGSKMSAHSDMYSYLKKDGESVRPSLTAILYINDDYKGGQIDFIHDGLCISPTAGSMVVFPSNKQHEVLEILEGNRYMVQTYVYPNPLSFYDKE